ncbi:MAG: phosphatase PAP2 family protein [Methylotenera sp.]|nr:phosphatase PAP2 family protein [Methylotenera sp.]
MSYRMRLYLNRMHQFDGNLCVAVNHTSQYRLIRNFFRVISRLGNGMFWFGLGVAIVIVNGADGFAPVLHLLLVALVGALLNKWLKGKTLRPRPYQVRQDICLTGTPMDKFSFPSGHTLHAVMLSTVALSYYPQLAMILIPFTIMIALSRVVLGLHYPSDVLAGALIGGLIASVSFLIV